MYPRFWFFPPLTWQLVHTFLLSFTLSVICIPSQLQYFSFTLSDYCSLLVSWSMILTVIRTWQCFQSILSVYQSFIILWFNLCRLIITDLVAQLLVRFHIKSFVSYDYGEWNIFWNVRPTTDFQLLKQQYDNQHPHRPFHHQSFEESHLAGGQTWHWPINVY